ncbi:DUF2797 domain-containing protein [Arthrobacter sp. CAN_C5]|uniref:DUF2797 domain-containing protein n=1 Tax=Arthrobacter sp. CAN_C5 TaxID=2760706 RepID=UPI001FD92431|nr:DUF2797 domain-containing protein [Arthrobacter sp. CAN_C5]MBP2215630.1 hypothetical protein [Arthrobacter sp. CAN_C5]
MAAELFLCRGVSWHREGPVLSLATPEGTAQELSLDQAAAAGPGGVDLGFRILSQFGERYCLGFHRVYGPDAREHTPCPRQDTAARGYQCGPCFARDDLRFMHDVHRSGVAPAGLLSYLAQNHWLYVATFADGASKVGTAADLRKWHRLAEQGAVVARYVASADDGQIVRVLEDAVTRAVGLAQAVRSAAKTAALALPRDGATLDGINAEFAGSVRALLRDGLDLSGFRVIDEKWVAPSSWSRLLASTGPQLYPHSLAAGEHGFQVEAMVGAAALVLIRGSEVPFLVDLARLKGQRIELGRYQSVVPEVQEASF